MGSGQNDDDTIEACIKHHWAYKKNKNLKTHNNRCDLNRKFHEKKNLVTYLEAPENLLQSCEMYPEAIVYLVLIKDHPMFLRQQRNIASYATSSPSADDDDDNNHQKSQEDPEDTTFRSRMTSKGIFKSRNMQRQEELNKKRKSLPSSDIIDLTKEKQIKSAERHSIAAKIHAEGVKCQSQIAAIEQAMKMGVSAEVLHPFMMQTLHTLFDTKKEEEIDDSNEVQFVRSITGNSKGDNMLKTESFLPSSSSTTFATGNFISTSRTNNRCGARCCAEEECVYSDGELDDESLTCHVCEKQVHSFCVQDSPGRGTYDCFKCVLNSPFALQMLDD